MLAGQMMQYPLTTYAIIDYGNRVFGHREIVSKLPDGSWHRYSYADMYKRTKQLAATLVNQLKRSYKKWWRMDIECSIGNNIDESSENKRSICYSNTRQ